jgi:hypothetical protein
MGMNFTEAAVLSQKTKRFIINAAMPGAFRPSILSRLGLLKRQNSRNYMVGKLSH